MNKSHYTFLALAVLSAVLSPVTIFYGDIAGGLTLLTAAASMGYFYQSSRKEENEDVR